MTEGRVSGSPDPRAINLCRIEMTNTVSPPQEPLRQTPLHGLHDSLQAKMVPFAGYAMPVQYPTGILKEHLHTRAQAGLFDVSHMGQRLLTGPHSALISALERVTPGDFQSLAPGKIRYTVLLNEDGGIIDDLMVTHLAEGKLGLIFNAGRKDVDDAFLGAHLPTGVTLEKLEDHALLAFQGPLAETVLARHCAQSASLTFMSASTVQIAGLTCTLSRSGYTGEDGYEISVPAAQARHLADILLAEPEVLPIGLGARDSLRLEAGLCLYGHDIDETIHPVEADLSFAIGKRRRLERGFPGADKILHALNTGPHRLRIGLKPEGKAPAREGTQIADQAGHIIGTVTSGGFSPSLNGPIAMGYVESSFAKIGATVNLVIRGKSNPAQIVSMPFLPHRYKRILTGSK